MIDLWYHLVELLPFSWVNYEFMKTALLAVIIITPCFGLAGTMVVANRMSFFSDVIAHSTLCGIAIGMLLGMEDLRITMILFAMLLAIAMNIFLEVSGAANDTVIGIILAATTALGVFLLSRGGSFNRYADLIVGNILSVRKEEIIFLLLLFAAVLLFWFFFGSYLALMSVDPSLVYGRAIPPVIVRTAFTMLIAVVVIISIRWIGVLIISAFFIIPAATARLWASSLRGYYFYSVLLSMVSGIFGLLISFYSGGAGGATMVLCSVIIYIITIIAKISIGKIS